MFFGKKDQEENEDNDNKGTLEVPSVPDDHPIAGLLKALRSKAESEGFEVRELDEDAYREKCENEGLPVPPQKGGKPRINAKNLEALGSTLTHVRQLEKLRDTYFRPVTHAVGDLIQWKSGMMNHKLPQYGEPVVVMDVLDPPMNDTDGPGSPYFNEPITIKIGWIDNKTGNFYMIGVDGARFEKFDG